MAYDLEEQEQLATLKAFWKQYGNLIMTAVTVVLLLFSDQISRRAGARGLLAFERLMGLILTAIAVEMLLRGVEAFVQTLHG